MYLSGEKIMAPSFSHLTLIARALFASCKLAHFLEFAVHGHSHERSDAVGYSCVAIS